jgi:type IV fimbrial biogenesis protein FimT
MLRRAASGVTLVEFMIAITVLGILLVAGAPAMRGLIENGRIRTAAESWKYGLALARAEAVRRNAPVEFLSDNSGWQVRRVSDATVLHRGSSGEAAAGLALTIVPDGANRVTYDTLGRTVSPNLADGSDAMAQVDFASANPPAVAGYRPLRLQLLAGGLSRLCDPAVGATDPRVCL